MIKLTLTSALIATLLPAVLAEYKLSKEYSGFDFVNSFDYFTGPDPTNGHVTFKGYATANATGLTGFLVGPNGTNIANPSLPPPIYLGVDHTNVFPTNTGRPSVRVSSVQTYNHSLILADILHMPSSTCGLWPAFWMLGTSATWPNAGEIDILENVNDADFNLMTLHTNAGLTVVNDTSLFNGTLKTGNCDVGAADQEKNVGCSIKDGSEVGSYGTTFNRNGGGVFAMQYTADFIAVWFFPRQAIPDDIKANAPVPPAIKDFAGSAWGKPNALFQPVSLNPTVSVSAAADAAASTVAAKASNVIVPLTAAAADANASASSSSTTPSNSTTAASSNSTTTAPTDSTTTTTTPSVLDTHFSSLQLVFTTTFCGDWAGKMWKGSSCETFAPTCEEYVSGHPEAFGEAYWAVNSVKVFV